MCENILEKRQVTKPIGYYECFVKMGTGRLIQNRKLEPQKVIASIFAVKFNYVLKDLSKE